MENVLLNLKYTQNVLGQKTLETKNQQLKSLGDILYDSLNDFVETEKEDHDNNNYTNNKNPTTTASLTYKFMNRVISSSDDYILFQLPPSTCLSVFGCGEKRSGPIYDKRQLILNVKLIEAVFIVRAYKLFLTCHIIHRESVALNQYAVDIDAICTAVADFRGKVLSLSNISSKLANASVSTAKDIDNFKHIYQDFNVFIQGFAPLEMKDNLAETNRKLEEISHVFSSSSTAAPSSHTKKTVTRAKNLIQVGMHTYSGVTVVVMTMIMFMIVMILTLTMMMINIAMIMMMVVMMMVMVMVMIIINGGDNDADNMILL